MSIPKTVVVNCAGMGSRLGMDCPKSLIELAGRPLIHWQLDLLRDVSDVRIVVGFRSHELIEVVLAARRDVTFVFNHDYHSTGTAGSLVLGAKHTQQLVLSLDGDLLVHPDDFRAMLESNAEFIGVSTPNSQEPVYVRFGEGREDSFAVEFSREFGDAEWTGLVQISASKLGANHYHVYQALEPHLPIRAAKMRARDIDTPEDYNSAILWIEEMLNSGVLHGQS